MRLTCTPSLSQTVSEASIRSAAERWVPRAQGHPGGGGLRLGKPRPWRACAHLLSDADVKGALGEALLEAVHAGAAAHGRVDAHHPAVQLRLGYQRIRKVVGVAAGLQQQAPGLVSLYRYQKNPGRQLRGCSSLYKATLPSG